MRNLHTVCGCNLHMSLALSERQKFNQSHHPDEDDLMPTVKLAPVWTHRYALCASEQYLFAKSLDIRRSSVGRWLENDAAISGFASWDTRNTLVVSSLRVICFSLQRTIRSGGKASSRRRFIRERTRAALTMTMMTAMATLRTSSAAISAHLRLKARSMNHYWST